MKQLVIKIGGSMDNDLEKVFRNPSKHAKPSTHTLYLKNAEELYELLSPKRLELLQHIIKHQAEKKTVSELAEELKRKQEAISRDAALLAKHNLIQKIKEKKMVHLKALYKSLEIKLSAA